MNQNVARMGLESDTFMNTSRGKNDLRNVTRFQRNRMRRCGRDSVTNRLGIHGEVSCSSIKGELY
jgi:hypothetical protein